MIKPLWKSKTFWANLIMALSFLLPEGYRPVFMNENFQGLVFFIVNTGLRLTSKDKVTIY